MDILFDINIILDVIFPERPKHRVSVAAMDRLRQRQCRLWVYTGSMQTLLYLANAQLKKQHPDLPNSGRLLLARKLLDRSLTDFQWLAALAGEGTKVFTEEDPEDAQLERAIARLGADARLLTRNADLSSRCGQAISPDDLLELDLPESSIEFIDLKKQQDHLRPELEKRIHTVLHHGRYIMGPEVQELEERLAAYVGVRHCIGVSSGTDSLLIAMMALGIGPGDEVITVPYTWISTAEMIALLGAKPVFVDIEETTFNMDPAKLEAAISERTKAIMPVGIYGQTANMTAINEIAARHGNLPVIEDAAQSFGATHHGRKSCALSTIGSTSFFPSKPLGCYGDGGALFTDDDALAHRMRQIRVHGQEKKHHHPVLGINGRLDTLQAAIVLAKLPLFDEEIERRQRVAQRYAEALANPDLPGDLIRPPVVPEENRSVFAQYTILSPNRDELASGLKKAGIPSVSYYAVPLHLQPVFAPLGHRQGDFPVAEKIAAQGLSLPMDPWIADEVMGRISESLGQVGVA